MPKFTEYDHHGHRVSVRADLLGKHREHCLCYSCEKFQPNGPITSCPLARELFSFCVRNNMVTPVWECPEFREKSDGTQ